MFIFKEFQSSSSPLKFHHILERTRSFYPALLSMLILSPCAKGMTSGHHNMPSENSGLQIVIGERGNDPTVWQLVVGIVAWARSFGSHVSSIWWRGLGVFCSGVMSGRESEFVCCWRTELFLSVIMCSLAQRLLWRVELALDEDVPRALFPLSK